MTLTFIGIIPPHHRKSYRYVVMFDILYIPKQIIFEVARSQKSEVRSQFR
jgi:hypothetical protein